jgi:hypothetical protein
MEIVSLHAARFIEWIQYVDFTRTSQTDGDKAPIILAIFITRKTHCGAEDVGQFAAFAGRASAMSNCTDSWLRKRWMPRR